MFVDSLADSIKYQLILGDQEVKENNDACLPLEWKLLGIDKRLKKYS